MYGRLYWSTYLSDFQNEQERRELIANQNELTGYGRVLSYVMFFNLICKRDMTAYPGDRAV